MTEVDNCDFFFVGVLMVMSYKNHLISFEKLLTQSSGLMDDPELLLFPSEEAASFTEKLLEGDTVRGRNRK